MTDPKSPSASDQGSAIQVLLADFSVRRSELESRGQRQSIVLQLHAAAAVALIGFVGTDLGSRELALFAIPAISFFSWLWYLDQETNIYLLAEYEREVIRPALADFLGTDLLQWEAYQLSRETIWQTLVYLPALLLLLVGPSVVAAALSISAAQSPWRYFVWILVLLVLLLWPLVSSLGRRRAFRTAI